MVVQAVDQASAPLENVKDKLDEVSGSIDGAKTAAEDSFPAIGKGAGDLADQMDDLGGAASSAAATFSGVWAEAVVVAGIALVSFLKYMKEVSDEHERLQDLATTLNLPVKEVESYSDAWLKVAQSLNEAARGYTQLGEAQSAALSGLGLDPANLGEASRVKTLVSLGKGTDLQKVDVLRRLFGLNDKDALAIIKEENRKFYGEAAAAGAYGVGGTSLGNYVNKQGIGAGQLDVGQLLNSGRLPTPQAFKDRQGDQQTAERAIREINSAVEKAQRDSARDSERARKAREKAELQASRDQYEEMARIAQQGNKIVEADAKALTKALVDNDKQIAAAGKEAWKDVNEQTQAALKQMQYPVNEFVEAWKDSMKDMVYFGDFSFKRLVARIIVQLTSRELFAAIDRVGDALDTALSAGGGGLIGGVKSFFKGIFGGNAGGGTASGVRLVGEEEPELVASGPNTMRVYNMRQMAFAAGGGAAQPAPVYNDNRTYTISGVETQQVVAYIENTRREDQRGMLRMLERNGFGSMR